MDGEVDQGRRRGVTGQPRTPEGEGAGGMGPHSTGIVPRTRAFVPGAPAGDRVGQRGPTPAVRLRSGDCGWGWGPLGSSLWLKFFF